jgi:hypothetical protein
MPTDIDLSSLKATLNNSGLQQSNSAAYQVISQLIQAVINLQSTNVNQQKQITGIVSSTLEGTVTHNEGNLTLNDVIIGGGGADIQDSGIPISNVPLLNLANVFTVIQKILLTSTFADLIIQSGTNSAGLDLIPGTGKSAFIDYGLASGAPLIFFSYATGANNAGSVLTIFPLGGVSIGNSVDPGAGVLSINGLTKLYPSGGIGLNGTADPGIHIISDSVSIGFLSGTAGFQVQAAGTTVGSWGRGTVGITLFPSGGFTVGTLIGPSDPGANSINASGNISALTFGTTGTWTPIDSSGAVLTFSIATGTYQKIGKLVLFNGQITYPATASAANALIGGLPFAATTLNFSVDIGAENVVAGLTAIVVASSTTIEFFLNFVLRTNVQMTLANVIFSGFYFTP